MHFLYFVPAAPASVTGRFLKEIGLGYLGVRPKAAVDGRGVSLGPGEQSGKIFAGDGTSAGYKPAEQVWTPGPDGKYFVGYQTRDGEQLLDLPRAEDLTKLRFVEGETLQIEDQAWTIPICRSFVRGSTLPQALALGPDGKSWTLQQLPEFAALCQSADKVWKAFYLEQMEGEKKSDDSAGLKVDEAAAICVQALGVNYRIGAVEASILGLLTTETMREILNAMIDAFEIMRVAKAGAEKKERPDTSSIADGLADSSRITSPRLPT